MSHLRSIDAQAVAAADYQALVERTRAAQRAAKERRRAGGKGMIDSTLSPDGEDSGESEAPEDTVGDQPKDGSAADGFGKHYA